MIIRKTHISTIILLFGLFISETQCTVQYCIRNITDLYNANITATVGDEIVILNLTPNRTSFILKPCCGSSNIPDLDLTWNNTTKVPRQAISFDGIASFHYSYSQNPVNLLPKTAPKILISKNNNKKKAIKTGHEVRNYTAHIVDMSFYHDGRNMSGFDFPEDLEHTTTTKNAVYPQNITMLVGDTIYYKKVFVLPQYSLRGIKDNIIIFYCDNNAMNTGCTRTISSPTEIEIHVREAAEAIVNLGTLSVVTPTNTTDKVCFNTDTTKVEDSTQNSITTTQTPYSKTNTIESEQNVSTVQDFVSNSERADTLSNVLIGTVISLFVILIAAVVFISKKNNNSKKDELSNAVDPYKVGIEFNEDNHIKEYDPFDNIDIPIQVEESFDDNSEEKFYGGG